MSHPANDQILDQAQEEWGAAVEQSDFKAMRAIIERLKEAGFDTVAGDLARDLIDLEDAMQ